jgi:hypothetical protein
MDEDTKALLKTNPFEARLSMMGVWTLLSPLKPKGLDWFWLSIDLRGIELWSSVIIRITLGCSVCPFTYVMLHKEIRKPSKIIGLKSMDICRYKKTTTEK